MSSQGRVHSFSDPSLVNSLALASEQQHVRSGD